MKPIDINLSATPFRNDTPLWGALIATAALAVGFSAYNGWAWFSAGSRSAQLQRELAGHHAGMEKMKAEYDRMQGEMSKLDKVLLETQADFVSDILRERNFSWTRLFNSLEDTIPWNVRLVSVRPLFDGDKLSIQVNGLAQTFEAYLAFQDQLSTYPTFGNVVPGDYNHGDAGDQVFFSLSFDYDPEAPSSPASPGDKAAQKQDGAASSASAEKATPAASTESRQAQQPKANPASSAPRKSLPPDIRPKPEPLPAERTFQPARKR